MNALLGIVACAVLFAAFYWVRQRSCGGECGPCVHDCERRDPPRVRG